jgi:methylmalonyl-CoA/ethylmalonyl-CoA epimerase
MKFHHIGIVTQELEAAVAFYESIGYAVIQTVEDPLQMVRAAFLSRDGDPLLEILVPTSKESPAFGWLKRVVAGPFHICYETPDIELAVEQLREASFAPVGTPQPASAFGGRRIVFVFGNTGGLIELLEAPK